MPTETIFQVHLVLGYVAWLLCCGVYVMPWLKSKDRVEAHRAIATLHGFRFFGLVFMIPASSAPIYPRASPGSPPMATSQPACLLCWLFSR